MAKTGKGFASFVKVALGEGVRNVLLFLIAIRIAHMTGSAGFGKLAFAQSIVVYLNLAVTLGTAVTGIRYVATRRESAAEVAGNLALMRGALAAALFVPFVAAVWMLVPSTEMRLVFAAVGFDMFSQAFNMEFAALGLEKPYVYAAMRAAVPAVYGALLLTWIGGSLYQIPLWNALVELAVFAAGAVALFGWRRLRSFRVDTASWVGFLKDGAPIAASLLCIQVYYNVDVTVLGLTQPSEVVGAYGAAYRLVMVALTAAVALISVYAPRFARRYEAGSLADFKGEHRAYAAALLVIGAAVAAVLFFAAEPLCLLLFGFSFQAAPEALRWLSVSMFFVFALTVFNGPLPYVGATRGYLMTHAAGAVLNVVLNLWWTPQFGIAGAGLSAVTTQVFILGASWWVWRGVLGKFPKPESQIQSPELVPA